MGGNIPKGYCVYCDEAPCNQSDYCKQSQDVEAQGGWCGCSDYCMSTVRECLVVMARRLNCLAANLAVAGGLEWAWLLGEDFRDRPPGHPWGWECNITGRAAHPLRTPTNTNEDGRGPK